MASPVAHSRKKVNEIIDVSENVCDIATQLSKDNEQYVYKPKRPLSKSFSDGFEENHVNGQHSPDELANMSTSQGFSLSAANTPAKPNVEQPDSPRDDEHPEGNVYGNQETIAQHKEENAQAEAESTPAAAESVEEKAEEKAKAEEKVETADAPPSPTTPTTPTPTTTEDSVGNDTKKQSETEVKENGDGVDGQSDDDSEGRRREPDPLDVPDYPPPQPPADTVVKKDDNIAETKVVTDDLYDHPKPMAKKNHPKEGDRTDYQPPVSGKPLKEPPPDFLFVVQSTHPYKNEDQDELSFDAGEMIYVIKFENPDEQDDGWLMGIKQCDRTRGVFPENFTKRLGQEG